MSSPLTTLKKHKVAIAVSAAINIGSVLFGFDTGVIGGVVALGSFKHEFRLDDKASYTNAASNVVSVLNLGAFLGALVPPLASRVAGRKPLLGLAGLLGLLGGILQAAAVGPTLGMVYGGRVVSGLGVGMISNVVPVFVAECAPKELRGVLVSVASIMYTSPWRFYSYIINTENLTQMSVFEMFLVSGGMIAYVSSLMTPSSLLKNYVYAETNVHRLTKYILLVDNLRLFTPPRTHQHTVANRPLAANHPRRLGGGLLLVRARVPTLAGQAEPRARGGPESLPPPVRRGWLPRDP